MNVCMRLFLRIETEKLKTANELNILIYRFMIDIKRTIAVRTSQQPLLHLILAFILGIKMLFTGLGRTVLEETVASVLSINGLPPRVVFKAWVTVSSNTDIPAGE